MILTMLLLYSDNKLLMNEQIKCFARDVRSCTRSAKTDSQCGEDDLMDQVILALNTPHLPIELQLPPTQA